MAESTERRPAWQRRVLAVLVAAGLAALGWGVNRGLDEGEESLRSEAPVRIRVETDPTKHYQPTDPGWQTYSFVTPEPRKRLGRPPAGPCREWRTWALARGGVDADGSRFYAYVQGKPESAILITGFEIDFVRRRKPIKGTHAYCPTGGAAANPRLVDVDLDTSPPAVRYAALGDDYPARRQLMFKLNGTDTEVFEISAHTRRCDCQWIARLHMVVDGEAHTEVLDDNGEPFRTSASHRSEHVQWDGKGWPRMSRAAWKGTLPMRWAQFRR
jgi:hypothetical protein